MPAIRELPEIERRPRSLRRIQHVVCRDRLQRRHRRVRLQKHLLRCDDSGVPPGTASIDSDGATRQMYWPSGDHTGLASEPGLSVTRISGSPVRDPDVRRADPAINPLRRHATAIRGN